MWRQATLNLVISHYDVSASTLLRSHRTHAKLLSLYMMSRYCHNRPMGGYEYGSSSCNMADSTSPANITIYVR